MWSAALATFIGTDANETITPTVVTPSVVATPAGAKPTDDADTIEGGGGEDTIDAGGGDDTVRGGLGDDTIQLGAGADVAVWSADDGNDAVDGGTGNDTFIYHAGTTLVAGTLVGGDDDDKLQVEGTHDFTTMSISEVEILQFVTFGAHAIFSISQFGSGLIDQVIGSGSTGSGSIGLDRLTVRGNSIDFSAVTFSSWETLDVISLLGTAADNTITGTANNDHINGGFGADLMTGLAGDDYFYVYDADDIVSELGGSGIDTVRSSISFDLDDTDHVKGAVENLVLFATTSQPINGSGNSLANVIIGTRGDNVLDGRAGVDILSGEGGQRLVFRRQHRGQGLRRRPGGHGHRLHVGELCA